MNIAVVVGRLSRPPEHRTLPSGEELAAFDVTVDDPDRRGESVPVVWLSPPAAAAALEVGEVVVVVGRVRRRFFRAAGVTQSRTEVVAEAVAPARRATAAHRLVSAAAHVVADGSELLPAPRRRR